MKEHAQVGFHFWRKSARASHLEIQRFGSSTIEVRTTRVPMLLGATKAIEHPPRGYSCPMRGHIQKRVRNCKDAPRESRTDLRPFRYWAFCCQNYWSFTDRCVQRVYWAFLRVLNILRRIKCSIKKYHGRRHPHLSRSPLKRCVQEHCLGSSAEEKCKHSRPNDCQDDSS